MSLKIKLTLLMIVLTAVMLSAFSAMILRDFRRDKIAYVLDSGLAHTRSVSLQIQTELNDAFKSSKAIMSAKDAKAAAFIEPDVMAYQKYKLPAGQEPQLIDSDINLKRWKGDALGKQADKLSKLVRVAMTDQVAMSRIDGHASGYFLAVKFKLNSGPQILVSAFRGGVFMEFFNTPQMLDTFLVSKKGLVLMKPGAQNYDVDENETNAAVFEAIQAMVGPELVRSYDSKSGKSYLISASKVKGTALNVFAMIPEEAAFAATKALVVKSFIFLLFLFFVAGFISVVTSSQLTSSLIALKNVTEKIASGDFGAQVAIKSKDEVGVLAGSVNKMSAKISMLMKEVVEKARMENELETARLVQSTLFPKTHLDTKQVEIRGFYQPASECSGDWWFYEEWDEKIFVCIGDATGHGVPAALVTSAIRSAASVVSNWRDLSADVIMSIFNKAVYSTADGQVMMTLFVGIYDKKTGNLEYSSASHNPPYGVPKSDSDLKHRDLDLLLEAVGPRLGESNDSTYTKANYVINPGSRMMFYTDGITELKSPEGKEYGERKLATVLANSHNEKLSVSKSMEVLNGEFNAFRGEAVLDDDITYFVFHRKS